VDETDVRILRVLGFTPFQQGVRGPDALRPSAIAAQLGLNAELVKDRLARMESSGVIQGYEAFPNLRHLGLAQTTVHYNLDGRAKARALAKLPDMEGISGVFEFVGPGVCVDVYYRSPAELERRLKLVATLADLPAPARLFDYPYPEVTGEMTPLDWRIVHALRKDARRPASDVGAELGVSAKTVNRHVDRLVAQGSIDVLPRVDTGQVADILPLNLACYFAPGPTAPVVAAILKALGEQAFYAWVPPSAELGNFDVFAYVRKPREIEQLRRKVADLPGVERVEALLPCNVVFTSDWLTRAIEERMSVPGVEAP
jgi:DNA-binding Lrp family transcriptional regulator